MEQSGLSSTSCHSGHHEQHGDAVEPMVRTCSESRSKCAATRWNGAERRRTGVLPRVCVGLYTLICAAMQHAAWVCMSLHTLISSFIQMHAHRGAYSSCSACHVVSVGCRHRAAPQRHRTHLHVPPRLRWSLAAPCSMAHRSARGAQPRPPGASATTTVTRSPWTRCTKS